MAKTTSTACIKCGKKGVYMLPNGALCKDHFLEYFERKVEKTIKKFNLISNNDIVCIATSGGKDSLAVLYTTMLHCKKHDIKHFALAIDEGIHGYRDHTLDDLRSFAEKYEVPFHVVSFKEVLGDTLDNIAMRAMKEFNKKPCTVCGIFRRTLLNRYAKVLGATKLVTGHNLDDESQALLMNLLQGNMRHNAALGPVTGLSSNTKFVPRVKPLYFVSEKETRLYAFLKKFKIDFSECPNVRFSFRAITRDKLNQMENVRMGSKNGIVNAFLEILPDLKEKYKDHKEFRYCNDCGEPCSKDLCNACTMIKELKLEWKYPEVKLQ